MPGFHLDQMLRFCGATTTVTGQQTVTVGGKLVSVEGDRDTHDNLGQLVSTSPGTITIGGKKIIVSMMDQAMPDTIALIQHVTNFPTPQEGSPTVSAYGGSGTVMGGLGSILGGNLMNGEMIGMDGNIIGQMRNFTNIGSGQGLSILQGLNGGTLSSIPSVGSTIVGQTSGNSFTFSSVQT